MKFGIRTPSLKKRIAARTSWKRYARHSLGLKAPRGAGWITNPRKAAYNRVYNRTSVSVDRLFGGRRSSGKDSFLIFAIFEIVMLMFKGLFLLLKTIYEAFSQSTFTKHSQIASTQQQTLPMGLDAPSCPYCFQNMVRRTARRGPNSGNEFWGCSGFPKCIGTRPIVS